jgi:hypothetical protein
MIVMMMMILTLIIVMEPENKREIVWGISRRRGC